MPVGGEHPISPLCLGTVLTVTSHSPRPSVRVTRVHLDIAHLPGKGSGPRGVSNLTRATLSASGKEDSAHTVWLQTRVCITTVLAVILLTEP